MINYQSKFKIKKTINSNENSIQNDFNMTYIENKYNIHNINNNNLLTNSKNSKDKDKIQVINIKYNELKLKKDKLVNLVTDTNSAEGYSKNSIFFLQAHNDSKKSELISNSDNQGIIRKANFHSYNSFHNSSINHDSENDNYLDKIDRENYNEYNQNELIRRKQVSKFKNSVYTDNNETETMRISTSNNYLINSHSKYKLNTVKFPNECVAVKLKNKIIIKKSLYVLSKIYNNSLENSESISVEIDLFMTKKKLIIPNKVKELESEIEALIEEKEITIINSFKRPNMRLICLNYYSLHDKLFLLFDLNKKEYDIKIFNDRLKLINKESEFYDSNGKVIYCKIENRILEKAQPLSSLILNVHKRQNTQFPIINKNYTNHLNTYSNNKSNTVYKSNVNNHGYNPLSFNNVFSDINNSLSTSFYFNNNINLSLNQKQKELIRLKEINNGNTNFLTENERKELFDKEMRTILEINAMIAEPTIFNQKKNRNKSSVFTTEEPELRRKNSLEKMKENKKYERNIVHDFFEPYSNENNNDSRKKKKVKINLQLILDDEQHENNEEEKLNILNMNITGNQQLSCELIPTIPSSIKYNQNYASNAIIIFKNNTLNKYNNINTIISKDNKYVSRLNSFNNESNNNINFKYSTHENSKNSSLRNKKNELKKKHKFKSLDTRYRIELKETLLKNKNKEILSKDKFKNKFDNIKSILEVESGSIAFSNQLKENNELNNNEEEISNNNSNNSDHPNINHNYNKTAKFKPSHSKKNSNFVELDIVKTKSQEMCNFNSNVKNFKVIDSRLNETIDFDFNLKDNFIPNKTISSNFIQNSNYNKLHKSNKQINSYSYNNLNTITNQITKPSITNNSNLINYTTPYTSYSNRKGKKHFTISTEENNILINKLYNQKIKNISIYNNIVKRIDNYTEYQLLRDIKDSEVNELFITGVSYFTESINQNIPVTQYYKEFLFYSFISDKTSKIMKEKYPEINFKYFFQSSFEHMKNTIMFEPFFEKQEFEIYLRILHIILEDCEKNGSEMFKEFYLNKTINSFIFIDSFFFKNFVLIKRIHKKNNLYVDLIISSLEIDMRLSLEKFFDFKLFFDRFNIQINFKKRFIFLKRMLNLINVTQKFYVDDINTFHKLFGLDKRYFLLIKELEIKDIKLLGKKKITEIEKIYEKVYEYVRI